MHLFSDSKIGRGGDQAPLDPMSNPPWLHAHQPPHLLLAIRATPPGGDKCYQKAVVYHLDNSIFFLSGGRFLCLSFFNLMWLVRTHTTVKDWLDSINWLLSFPTENGFFWKHRKNAQRATTNFVSLLSKDAHHTFLVMPPNCSRIHATKICGSSIRLFME